MALVFGCERVNLILVDRFNKRFFRSKLMPSGNNKITTYPIEASLAGYVAISCHAMLTDNIEEESRFNQLIDDPNGNSG